MSIRAYKKLFEPIHIAKLEIINRIVMAPMGIGSLCTEEGGFSQRAIDYFIERARGGTGLIITGIFKIENEIERFVGPNPPCITAHPHHFIATASELTEGVHAYGSKIFVQLTAGFGRSANPSEKVLAVQPVAPSAIPNYWEPRITCRELKTEEVEQLVKAFGDAAEIAVEAGFDGVEIHAVHEGYLVDQFAIALFNRRTDKYGGDLKDRLTFSREIVREVKDRLGEDFPVSLRFSIKSYIKDWGQGALPGESFIEAGRDVAEGLEAAVLLEEAGYDAFNSDAGSYDAWYWAHPPLYQQHGCILPLAEQLKKVVKVPVMVAGRMELPELAEKTLTGNMADMVTIGRGLLAEPHWPKKILLGKIKDIRPCLGCHDGCFQRMLTKGPLSCTVNPACGRESEFAIRPVREIKDVMIIGGGVAGMEAARVAALMGHKVALYEKSDKLGGHLVAASAPSFKKDKARLLEWYKYHMDSLDICVNLGNEITPEMVLERVPDCTIVATGSSHVTIDVPGIKKEKVCTASDLLLGNEKSGNSVVVVGGGLAGCETALWLAQQDKKVTVVELLDDLMCGSLPVPHANRTMLIDLLKFHNVTIYTGTSLLEVTDEGAIVIDKFFNRNMLPADTVSIAVGLKSDRELYRRLSGEIANVYAIGDAQQTRKIMHAIWEANEVARNI